VPAANKDELEGITLNVYLYAVKKGTPVGPRDVVKGAHLSSPSVAYRHLEKLEDMGLLQKNEYGEYTVKRKARVGGYMWLGKRMVPMMLSISLVFLGILIVELIVLALHYSVETFEFKIFFLLLMLITGFAMAVFIVEGLLQRRRLRRSLQTEQGQNPA
jgi:DNA-binding transcriptional ArsR family regulator